METEKPCALVVVSQERIQQIKRKLPDTRQMTATRVVDYLIDEFLKEKPETTPKTTYGVQT